MKNCSFVEVALSTSVKTAPNAVTPAGVARSPGTWNSTSSSLLFSAVNSRGLLKAANCVG